MNTRTILKLEAAADALARLKERIQAGVLCRKHVIDGVPVGKSLRKRRIEVLQCVQFPRPEEEPFYLPVYATARRDGKWGREIHLPVRRDPFCVFVDGATGEAGWLYVERSGIGISYPEVDGRTTLAAPPCSWNPRASVFQIVYHDPVVDALIREPAPLTVPSALLFAWDAWEHGVQELQTLVENVWKENNHE